MCYEHIANMLQRASIPARYDGTVGHGPLWKRRPNGVHKRFEGRKEIKISRKGRRNSRNGMKPKPSGKVEKDGNISRRNKRGKSGGSQEKFLYSRVCLMINAVNREAVKRNTCTAESA